MAPQTRRSRTVGRPRVANPSDENQPQIAVATQQGTTGVGQDTTKSIQPSSNLHKRKRAVSHTVSQNATNLPGPANSKRARDMDGRPMAVDLIDGGDTEEDEAVAHVVKANPKQRAQLERPGPGKAKQQRDRGKGKRDCRQQSDQSSSFQLQPCRNDESLPDSHMLDDFNVDGGVENEDDWFNDQHVVEDSHKNSSKMALERPTWSSAAPSSMPSVAGCSSLTDSVMSLPLTQAVVRASTPSVIGLTSTWSFGGSSQASSADVPRAPPSTPTTGASSEDIPATSTAVCNVPDQLKVIEKEAEAETDLVFLPGSNKVMLTLQRPLVRIVIQDSFDILRASLMFTNAFPDCSLTIEFVKDALVRSALNHAPGARYIYQRLLYKDDYISKLITLPRTRISLYRYEVKERCCAIVVPAMMAIGDQAETVNIVEKELSDYTYTFPRALKYPRAWAAGIVMRTRPYRNDRIITVLRDLIFSGSSSFATRYQSRFPRQYEGSSVIFEVPIAMVALVATGLYAAIYEWRTGEHKPVDFTANSFMDVYSGHVNTMQHVRDSKPDIYHQMMSNIYSLANVSSPGSVGTAIADLDLDELE